jgi:hypothetical protein
MAETLKVHVLHDFTSPDIMHFYAAGQIIEIDQARLDYLLGVSPAGTFAVEGVKAAYIDRPDKDKMVHAPAHAKTPYRQKR